MCEFDQVDDAIVAEIFLWLLAQRAPGPSTDCDERFAVQAATRFARTCKRIHGVWETTPDVWALVDAGRLLETPTRQLAWCRKLTLLPGAVPAGDLSTRMPNLTALRARLIGNKDIVGVAKSLASLAHLEDLEFGFEDLPVVPAHFEITLEHVKTLWLGCIGPAVRTVLGGCPGLTRLCLHWWTSAGELRAVWDMCPGLQSLDVFIGDVYALEESGPETAKCARTLEELTISVAFPEDQTRGIELVCRCFPNIVVLDLCREIVHPSTVRAIATLRRLESLRISISVSGDTSAMSSELTALGHTAGAPFRRIALGGTRADVGGFLSSPRCSRLRELDIVGTPFITWPDVATATSTITSLRVELVQDVLPTCIPYLMARCQNVEVLDLLPASNEQLREVGLYHNMAPRIAKLRLHNYCVTEEGFRGIAPILQHVAQLTIDCSGAGRITVDDIAKLVDGCPYVHELVVHKDWNSEPFARAVGAKIRENIFIVAMNS